MFRTSISRLPSGNDLRRFGILPCQIREARRSRRYHLARAYAVIGPRRETGATSRLSIGHLVTFEGIAAPSTCQVGLAGMQATGSGHWGLLPTHATDFGPDPEFLSPGSSMLCGSDVIAAEVEQVIDLIWAERKRCA